MLQDQNDEEQETQATTSSDAITSNKHLPGLKKIDKPKSIAFKGDVSFLSANKKFSGLRSR